MKNWGRQVLGYGTLLLCILGFLVLGWQQQSAPATQQPQAVTLIKRQQTTPHSDQASNYSPDKTYRSGDLVVKNGQLYEVKIPSTSHS